MAEEMFGDPETTTADNQSTEQPTTQEADTTTQEAPESEVDPNSLFADQLKQIVADDGRQKYADVPTALASIPHAQTHIQTLTNQVRELQEELQKRKGMEELMESLQTNGSNQEATEQPSVAGLDATAVQQLIDAHLEEKARATQLQSNAEAVKAALLQKYGDKAKDVFAQKAKELGMSVAELTQLSKTAPKAAQAFFSTAPVSDAQPTVGSSVVHTPAPKQQMPEWERKFRQGDTVLADKWEQAKQNALRRINGEN